MIRRAVEGDRTFGMVLPKPTLDPEEPGFMELGVLLRIVNIEFFPDGRSLLETVGVSRFKVTRHGFLDGYIVANIEKVDDISLAEEEALEVSEIGHGRDMASQGGQGQAGDESPSMAQLASTAGLAGDLDSMPTKELANFGVEFVRRMQVQSVPWLAARMLAIYGECPADPATFPWWFACVFPVSDVQKYRLLGTSSVRQRLKISCQWIAEWEASRVRAPLPHPSLSSEYAVYYSNVLTYIFQQWLVAHFSSLSCKHSSSLLKPLFLGPTLHSFTSPGPLPPNVPLQALVLIFSTCPLSPVR